MADETPTGEDAVPSFLHALMWASLFACVDTLLAGKWRLSLGTLTAALVFHGVSIKWPRIKAGTRFDWSGWNKWISNAVRVLHVLLVLASITVALTAYYAIHRMLGSERTQTFPQESSRKDQNVEPTPPSSIKGESPTGHSSSARRNTQKKLGGTAEQTGIADTGISAAPAPGANGRAQEGSNAPLALTRPPVQPADWHDKQNWRRFLRTGMNKTKVRQLFGEPERVSVFGDLETWEYGRGEITFDMENHLNGSLYSWHEP
jgi:hypothetical protein